MEGEGDWIDYLLSDGRVEVRGEGLQSLGDKRDYTHPLTLDCIGTSGREGGNKEWRLKRGRDEEK